MKAKIILSQSTHKLGKRRKFRRMDLSTGDLRPGFFNSLGGSGAGETVAYLETVNFGASIDKLIKIFDTPGGFESLDPFNILAADGGSQSNTYQRIAPRARAGAPGSKPLSTTCGVHHPFE